MREEKNIPEEEMTDKSPQATQENSQPSEQNIDPVTDAELPTTNSKLQTEDMEVHKHPHHITKKKKWPEYLLEFFMLFLAVFLGFLAENEREHLVNAKKEKHYMRSMVEDLQMDTAIFKVIIRRAEGVMNKLDTVTKILLAGRINDSLTIQLYRLNLPILSSIQIMQTDRTTSQLKNAGGLHLIRNQVVVKSLFDYWTKGEEIKNNAQNYNELRLLAREKSYSIFNARYYSAMPDGNRLADQDISKPHDLFGGHSNPVLMTTDPSILIEFANRLNHLKNSNQYIYIPNLKEEFSAAINLIDLIKKEYHLE